MNKMSCEKNKLFQNRNIIVVLSFFVFLILAPRYAKIEISGYGMAFVDAPSLEIVCQNGNEQKIGTFSRYYASSDDRVYAITVPLESVLWDGFQYNISFPIYDGYIVMETITFSVGNIPIYSINYENWEDVHWNNQSYELLSDDIFLGIINPQNAGHLGIPINRSLVLKWTLLLYLFSFLFTVALFLLGNKCNVFQIVEKNGKFTNFVILAWTFITYELCKSFSPFLHLTKWVNWAELFFGMLAVATMIITMHNVMNDRKQIIVCCATCLLPIFFSLHGICNYFTVDELNGINENLSLSDDLFRHWFMGQSRTNYLIMNTLFSLIPSNAVDLLGVTAEQYAKLVHWFCGFVSVNMLCWFVDKRFLAIKKSDHIRGLLWILMLYSCLLTPVVSLAMDNYNYDLFSMMFSVWAAILMWSALTNQLFADAIGSLVFAALAAQEKLSATPVVILVSILYVTFRINLKGKIWRAICYFAEALLAQIATLGITEWWVIGVLHSGKGRINHPKEILTILTYSLHALNGVIASSKLLNFGESLFLGRLIMYILITTFGGVLFYFLIRLFELGNRNFVAQRIVAIVGLVYFIVAIGTILSRQNNIVFFEVMKTSVQALSTVSLVISFIVLICILIGKWTINAFEAVAILFVCVGVPVMYTFVDDYITPRYMDIFIMMFVVLFVILFGKNISMMKMNRANIMNGLLVIGAFAFTIIEVYPSARFGFTIYEPLWNVSSWNEKEEFGSDWGAMPGTAGPMIEEYCIENNIDLSNVLIADGYWGTWASNKYDIEYVYINAIPYKEDQYLTSNVFYCMENYANERFGWGFPMDDSIEPLMKIKYRNKTVARIFSGDQLIDYFKGAQ